MGGVRVTLAATSERPCREQRVSEIRLTSLAHGGGCGCKLAPSVLQKLLAGQPSAPPFAQLLVGTETADDAAVWQIDRENCVIATTDFFMPIVDDPRDFGRIAAANALSDVYAMGGKPIFALAILGMPLEKLSIEVTSEILAGGASICAEAGIPIAGGHSIDTPEPIYGLAVIGLSRSDDIRRNSDARPGDALILTKGIGVGIYSAAFKKGVLSKAAYDEMIATTTLLNAVGSALGRDAGVHGMTDITGFGLLGHALEMARGSRAMLEIRFDSIPLLSEAASLLRGGYATGASARNWTSYGGSILLSPELSGWQRTLLTDPQTSGGLLIACAPERADEFCAKIIASGCPLAHVIGSVAVGEPIVRVT
jgi:selenide,water dikinase